MNQTVKLTTDQIISTIHAMPPEECRRLLYTLAERAAANREERMEYAESQFGSYVSLAGWIGMP